MPNNNCKIHTNSPYLIWINDLQHWGCPGCNEHDPVVHPQPKELSINVGDDLSGMRDSTFSRERD